MHLDPSAFKAYDLRGPVPAAFDAEGAGRVALAFVAYLRGMGAPEEMTVVLARDDRPSSTDIGEQVRKNLVAAGVDVIDLGLSTSPMFYFGVNTLKADGGMMITASHNPLPDNGLKMVAREAVAIGAGQGMEQVRDLALGPEPLKSERVGTVRAMSILKQYVDFLCSEIVIEKPLSIVIDAGNGMAPVVLNELLPRLKNVTAEKLYFDVDLTFPNHEANPLKEETLVDLKAAVAAADADVGIAFDGDADRVGFITARGAVVRCDMIVALLAQELLGATEKKEVVGFEVKSSRVVGEIVEENGGEARRIPTGHAAANKMMRECDAALAGELSCHFYFRETRYRDGAILAMLKVLAIVSRGVPLEKLMAPFEARYVQSGEHNFDVADKDAIIAVIAEQFSDGEHTHIDGLSVEYADWWFNVRASNTEDVLRLNVEATTQKLLDEKFAQLKGLITPGTD